MGAKGSFASIGVSKQDGLLPKSAVRRALAREMVRQAACRGAWILDDTGFPKKGTHSVGVARQYSGTLGKIGNCQVAVSLNYATADGCFPVDFQLYLPQSWTEDQPRRQKGFRAKKNFWVDLAPGQAGMTTYDIPAAWVLPELLSFIHN